MAVNRVKDQSGIRWLYIIFGVIILLVALGAFFGYQKYTDLQNENQRLSNPEEAAKSEIEDIKDAISAIIEVPTDEEPTIANVVDVTKLGDQLFFANAQNGDKLLVYQNAKKAILYRPSTNKIIEVSTINIDDQATSDKNTSDKATKDKNTTENNLDQNLPGLQ